MNWENAVNKDGSDMAANEDQKIFIGRRPARETPRNQGGGRAKRHSCQELNDVGDGKMNSPLKFGGLPSTRGPFGRESKSICI